MEAIKEMSISETATQLCEFVHCYQWMATRIPDFQQKVEPLQEILEIANKVAGNWKRKRWRKLHYVTYLGAG